MNIKYATTEDITAIAEVEAECFPPAEAATEEEFMERIRYYGNHFWLMYEAEKLIAFVDGFVTDEADLTDEMYEKSRDAQRKRSMADDFWCQYFTGLSQKRICGGIDSSCNS